VEDKKKNCFTKEYRIFMSFVEEIKGKNKDKIVRYGELWKRANFGQ